MNAVATIHNEADAFERVPPVGIKFHDYANIFPWMEGAAFDELKADIAANGIREPIVFLDDQILDGRNRYMAARDLGIEYPRVEYRGDDPLGYVVSLNLRRRHLTDNQRAMVAKKLANMPEGRPTKTVAIETVFISQERAAEMMGVSVASVKRASSVIEHGTPELVTAVEDGSVALSNAAEVAKLPIDEQQSIVEAGPAAVKEVAKVVRESGADAETIALRKSVIEAAKQGLAPERINRRNPIHEHNPAFRMLMRIVGPCRAMAEQVERGEIIIAEALSGFLDDVPGQRDRDLSDVARARDFLTLFLETSHAD